MKRTIELLAPGGDVDSIKAAIAAGADAVYCGLDRFNARNRATNISVDDLNGILRLSHQHHCQVFITMNIIIVESEIPALIGMLNKLINTSIDGIIVQDLGLLYILINYFKGLKIHASTQFTTHNEGQVMFLSKLSATRVNLSRELNSNEIKSLAAVGHEQNMLTEVFVHGSYCLSFSGICYFSSVHGGNSGNRGRCSQPCRDQYLTTGEGKNFPLNLKDNSAYTDLKTLHDAGVDSIKIEGRIKKFHYVYTIVDAWREQLQRFYDGNKLLDDPSALYKVFNRDFSNGFLKGAITKDMFIDNPRDHSAVHLTELNGGYTDENIEKAKGDIYNERTEIIQEVEDKLASISIAKAPISIRLSGECGSPLKVSVTTPNTSFDVFSEITLTKNGNQTLNREIVLARLKALNETEYFIEKLELEDLQPNVFLPFKELTSIKRRLLFVLNDSREFMDPIAVPVIKKHTDVNIKPSLSVLISSQDDLNLCQETSATIYFQLPNGFKNEYSTYINLFTQNKEIIPWFPSILIGEDYTAAVEFLRQLQPKCMVTNNTGLAYEAYKNGIPWIAGPFLNIVNSFSLLCLKENFNCAGSFLSNEINRTQLKSIKKPDGFDLYFSIYHPIELMTSRQCLFHQVTGCGKDILDDDCIQQCDKTSSITNLKKESFVIEKSKGNYHHIYNDSNYLNTDIITDVPNFFSSFLIDVRDIKTETIIALDKLDICKLFENLLNEHLDSKIKIKQNIHPTTNAQYRKGI